MAISQALLDAQKRAADRATAQGGTIQNAYTKSIPTPTQPAPAPIQPQTQQPQMTSDQLFSGIVSGQYTPSQTDPSWTSLYQGGSATPEQKAAYQRYTQANALVDQIKSGQVAPDPNNPQWQAMYQNGQPTQAQQDAYKIWDNLVKTGKVQTNNLGIPNTIPKVSGTTDVSGKTIPLSQLKNANAGYVDLKNMLGASINGDNLLNGIDNQTAGLLALYGQSTAQDKEAMAIQDKLVKAMESMGMQAQDIQSAMDQQGVGAAYEQVKQLSLKAAQLQGELEKFDVNTMQATENIGNQPIADVFVTGQQAQVNRQRSLERLSRSAELSAVIGLQQAYKGNAELGIELATKSVDLKYAPIMNQINTLQTQLGFANERATKADQKRSDVIKSLLDIKLKKVEEEKANQLEIQKMAIEAATNGAPLNVVNQMRSAADPASAAALGANYIKGSLESIGESATPQFNVNAGGIPSTTTGNITVSAGTTQNRPDRNNNPLNIKVPSAGIEEARRRYNDPGATIDPVPATDGGQFIKFSDPNVGVQAAVTLLRMGYNNLEVGAALKRWSGSGYGSEIAPQYAGRTIGNLTDSELADLVVRMAKREGFTGKVNTAPAASTATAAQGVAPATAKLTGAQVGEIAEGNTLIELANQVLTLGESSNWAGTGGLGGGTIKSWLANVGIGSDEGIQMRNLIGNIKATIAKARGGTSFTANEEKLLNSYTPGINDTPAQIKAKLRDLIEFIRTKNENLRNAASGGTAPTQTSETGNVNDFLTQQGY